MKRTSLQILAAVGGLAMTSLVTWQATGAAFSGTTANSSNVFSSGTVTLVDDDANAVMFDTSAAPMVPGDSLTKCIEVTYTGTSYDLTAVRLYASLGTNVDSFANHLDITIEQGTGGSFANCSGFTSASTLFTGTLASLTSTNTDYASGLTAWTPSAVSLDRVYRFTVVLGNDTPNSAQGDSATATFTWETQSA